MILVFYKLKKNPSLNISSRFTDQKLRAGKSKQAYYY